MSKLLVIMQGIPGSGKGYVSKLRWPEATVCSADDYFRALNSRYDDGGEGFDPSHLGRAHKGCKQKAFSSMEKGDKIVLIDNTNLDDRSIMTYVKIGREFGYDIEICRVECPRFVASARNTHGVPSFVYERMGASFDSWTKGDKFKDVKLTIVNNDPAYVD